MSNEFSFCPSCGALVVESVCTQCGTTVIRNSAVIGRDDYYDGSNAGVGSQNNAVGYNYDYNNGYQQSANGGFGNQAAGMQYTNGSEGFQTQAAAPAVKSKGKVPAFLWVIGGITVFLMGTFLIVALVIGGCLVFALASIPEEVTTVQVTTNGTSTVVTPGNGNTTTPSGSSSSSANQYAYVYSEKPERDFALTDDDYAFLDEDTDDLMLDEIVNEYEMYCNYSSYDIFQYAHQNQPRMNYAGLDYYTLWGDSIDYNQSYGLEQHNFTYSGMKDQTYVNAAISYYQIVSDTIPNVDEINKALYRDALNEFVAFMNGKSGYSTTEAIEFTCDSYVTYNDNRKMSVLMNNVINTDMNSTIYLYADNIDIQEGKLLTMEEVANFDSDFGGVFRELNNTQNGYAEVVDGSTDEELLAYIQSPNAGVVFFTPCGLEVGFSYRVDGYYYGWLTITLPEMEEYLVNPSYNYITPHISALTRPEGEEYDDFYPESDDYDDTDDNADDQGLIGVPQEGDEDYPEDSI